MNMLCVNGNTTYSTIKNEKKEEVLCSISTRLIQQHSTSTVIVISIIRAIVL